MPVPRAWNAPTSRSGCALYMRHMYNQAIVDNFIGDEYVVAERKQPLMKRMATSVKEVQRLSAHAKAATGNAGGPFVVKSERAKGGGNWKQPAKHGSSFSPAFDEPPKRQSGNDRPRSIALSTRNRGTLQQCAQTSEVDSSGSWQTHYKG